jgi:hypothetical protein
MTDVEAICRRSTERKKEKCQAKEPGLGPRGTRESLKVLDLGAATEARLCFRSTRGPEFSLSHQPCWGCNLYELLHLAV